MGETPIEALSPDAFRDYSSQPLFIHDPADFVGPPFRSPSFDCSIQQLLSPVFTPQLPVLSNATDPILLAQPLFQPSSNNGIVKTEDNEEELVREPILSHQSMITKLEQPPTSPQLTFADFHSIPKALSPWNSPLLEKNPTFRHLYAHFIQNTCKSLVPYDDRDNPFRSILAQMALAPEAPHLLATILACSAAQRACVKNETPPKYLISSLLQMTLEGLRKAVGNPEEASKDTTLATAITLSSYNIISSDVSHWRMHLDGAREIILHRRRTERRPSDERVRSFLFKWFAYLDVIAGASGLTLKDQNCESAVSIIEDVTENHHNQNWQPSRLDTFTGFTARLLPILLRIGRLAHQKRIASQNGIDLLQNEEFLEHVQALERDVVSAQFDIILSDERFEVELENQLRACNEAFHAAARLHIQRRLRNMSSEEVQPTVQQIFDAIKLVPEGSGPEISLLYPLFSAGVEATGNLRDFAQFRMTEMEKIGIGNVQRAKKVMFETWKQSDLKGSVRWEDVIDEFGWDLSLA